MKKITILILIVCLVAIGCVKSPGGHVAAAKVPAKAQKYIGRFSDNVNIYRKHGDTIEIQREQEQSFDVYKLDMNTAGMNYEYTAKDDANLLYYKQLSAGNALEVKRLGNSEEDNILLLKGQKEITIGRRIAYSDGALVSASPSERYVIYCAAEGVVNTYGLYVYDIQKGSTTQLIGAANEELLNDFEWNISWSPKEDYIAVSNRVLVNVEKGSILGDISALTMTWSPSGSKIAYVKQDSNGNKTLCIFDFAKAANSEVFVCDQDEFLPGYMVWSSNESRLAIVTAAKDINEDPEAYTYKAIYSLDLTSKEAKRIDTALKLDASTVAQLENIYYNDSGNLFSFTSSYAAGSNLHVYNLNTSAYEIFFNVEYLHNQDNESYVCSAKNNLYFAQGGSLIELKENMDTQVIKSTEGAIDDIYITQDGNTMIVVESQEECRVLRQIVNFNNPI